MTCHLQALKEYSPDEATVIRSGRSYKIHSSELVPGDIIQVHVGDKIPADCRVLSFSSSSFRVDQALLTGESMSVSKVEDKIPDEKAVRQDMTNMLFSVSLLEFPLFYDLCHSRVLPSSMEPAKLWLS